MTNIPLLTVRTGDSRLPYRDTPQGHMPKTSLPNPAQLKVRSTPLCLKHNYTAGFYSRHNLRAKQSGKKTLAFISLEQRQQ